MKKFCSEFRAFVARGNVIDLAVGVIIGGAFQKIVTSLVNDILMPLVTIFTGGLDFTNHFIVLDGGHYETLAAAQEAGAAVISYGSFLTQALDFLLMALVIFLLVKGMNRLARETIDRNKTPKEPPRLCPYCRQVVDKEATRCPHCTSMLNDPSLR